MIFQLIYKHGLAKHPELEEMIDFLFSTMKEFRLGKSSTIFHNAAKDLGHMVLTNKKDQVDIMDLEIKYCFTFYLS